MPSGTYRKILACFIGEITAESDDLYLDPRTLLENVYMGIKELLTK